MDNYVRNAWYVVCWEQDLAVDKPLGMTILNEPVVVWRTAQGNLHALEDRCVHRLAALSLGRCEGEHLRCMYHGFLYSPDGEVAEIPGQASIPPKARARRYPVVQKDSWIWIWMGRADAADPALIPSAISLDNPAYIMGRGQVDYSSEARLINDNLLDFSHLSYVHANSFGTGLEFAAQPPKISPLPRGVRYERWTPNNPLGGNADFLVDFHQTYDYLIPGILVMRYGAYPLGTAEKVRFGAPNLDDSIGFQHATSQAVTPMTDRTSRYFFSIGTLGRLGTEADRDQIVAMTEVAFNEDKVMIEAQQRIIDLTPNPAVLPTVHDQAVLRFNRLIEELVEQERGSVVPQVA